MIDELEESLKDYQEGQKKDEDCLSEMFFENIILSKEYVKSLEEIIPLKKIEVYISILVTYPYFYLLIWHCFTS